MAAKNKQTAINPTVSTAAPTSGSTAATQRIETFGKSFEGKGRLILYILGAAVALAILSAVFYSWQVRTASAAQAALGKALQIHEAQVSASPVPNSSAPVYATEKERAEKAINAFEEVANNYGSPYREKAQYLIAINRLKLDREAGLRELEGLANNSNRETAGLAKFALAEARAADKKYDEAVSLYSELSLQSDLIVPLETINFALGSVYEKQGKTAEAADIFFNLAKQAREAKDAEGKPAVLTATARQAAQKLEKLDPTKYAQLPAEPTSIEF